jgi:hypothetical protein
VHFVGLCFIGIKKLFSSLMLLIITLSLKLCFALISAIGTTRDLTAIQFCTKPGGNMCKYFECNFLIIPTKVIKFDR